MGGLLILLCALLPFLALSRFTLPALTVLFVTVGCGAIGFLDDFIKLRHRRSLGLAGRWKLAAARRRSRSSSASPSTRRSHLDTSIYVPVVDVDIPLSYAYYPFLFLVIAGAANGANLTDGLDGLAAGTGIIALLTFLSISVIAYIRSRRHRRALRLPARPRDPRRGADRGRDRLPLVQRLPGRGLHGRHRLDGVRRRARRLRDRHRHRGAAAPDRRDLRRRGALGDHPGRSASSTGGAGCS